MSSDRVGMDNKQIIHDNVVRELPHSILEIEGTDFMSNIHIESNMSQTVMCDPNAETLVVNESEDLLTMATDDEQEYHQCLNIIHQNIIRLPSNIEDWLMLAPNEMSRVFDIVRILGYRKHIRKEGCIR